MTDQEKLAELRNRIDEAAQDMVLMPATRQMGAGLNIQMVMVAALPPERWDAILAALDRE